ncbi:hypothetical protein SDC9_79863 [bioreactor metagenome]|uniref:Uncharacterized protein n=1 Tax=bioreactor metagenome TaxID=1076179 RepID=A0A644Z3H2_9ZZZZ
MHQGDVEPGRQRADDLQEPARDQADVTAAAVDRPDEFLGPRGVADPRGDLGQDADRHPGQRGDPSGETLGEVDLAPHRLFGDPGDLLA